ncbi:MAG: helix-turn-helix domain-containing protein [Myxococcales bacterium]|nr:helix-turn-helix domain-containing protein [Myxococcales bacterium]
MDSTLSSPKGLEVKFPPTASGRREWIKAALRARGWSLAKIARAVGVARPTPRNALWRPSPRMEHEIASRLGLQPEDIWPERYSGGSPLCRSCRASRSCRSGGAQ